MKAFRFTDGLEERVDSSAPASNGAAATPERGESQSQTFQIDLASVTDPLRRLGARTIELRLEPGDAPWISATPFGAKTQTVEVDGTVTLAAVLDRSLPHMRTRIVVDRSRHGPANGPIPYVIVAVSVLAMLVMIRTRGTAARLSRRASSTKRAPDDPT